MAEMEEKEMSDHSMFKQLQMTPNTIDEIINSQERKPTEPLSVSRMDENSVEASAEKGLKNSTLYKPLEIKTNQYSYFKDTFSSPEMQEVDIEAEMQMKSGKYMIEDDSILGAFMHRETIPYQNFKFLSSQNSQFDQLMQVAGISQQKSNKFVQSCKMTSNKTKYYKSYFSNRIQNT